jgi:hypothetical protein
MRHPSFGSGDLGPERYHTPSRWSWCRNRVGEGYLQSELLRPLMTFPLSAYVSFCQVQTWPQERSMFTALLPVVGLTAGAVERSRPMDSPWRMPSLLAEHAGLPPHQAIPPVAPVGSPPPKESSEPLKTPLVSPASTRLSPLRRLRLLPHRELDLRWQVCHGVVDEPLA